MNIQQAKESLDKIINKSRVHLYKPIQIAEILYRDRVHKDIQLDELETYRNQSKKWRDIICLQFLGRTSTSSARYQDDIFNENALPPSILQILSEENKTKSGVVESYIYKRFAARYSQVSSALSYCTTSNKTNFRLDTFIGLFREEAGLRRSIDKIYEIIVYALFSAITEAMELEIQVSYNPNKVGILHEFQDFATNLLNISDRESQFKTKAKIYRVGVTNAADRGLDMWANFGLAIQIKHLSLSEELAEDIVHSVSADRIVIVCKNAEEKVIVSLLHQIGWRSKIQAIITERDLLEWYEKSLRGQYSDIIGNKVLEVLHQEILSEFPSAHHRMLENFLQERGYTSLTDTIWTV